jgi:hypothetical protein
MTYNIIKTQLFLHEALDYSQIRNFTLDHNYKFKLPSYKIALNLRTCCDFLPSLTIFFQPPYLFQAQFHLMF